MKKHHLQIASEPNVDDVFSNIKGSKALPQINIFTGDNIITNEELLVVIKSKWKKEKRTIKEIKNIKVYYDVLKSNFVIMVITETDENIIIIEGSEFNGKK